MKHDKHPAKPTQKDSFEKGLDHKPDRPEADFARGVRHGEPGEEEPDFARGVRHGEPGEEGRFSEGQEQLPDSPEKRVERRFSEGVERSPISE